MPNAPSCHDDISGYRTGKASTIRNLVQDDRRNHRFEDWISVFQSNLNSLNHPVIGVTANMKQTSNCIESLYQFVGCQPISKKRSQFVVSIPWPMTSTATAATAIASRLEVVPSMKPWTHRLRICGCRIRCTLGRRREGMDTGESLGHSWEIYMSRINKDHFAPTLLLGSFQFCKIWQNGGVFFGGTARNSFRLCGRLTNKPAWAVQYYIVLCM